MKSKLLFLVIILASFFSLTTSAQAFEIEKLNEKTYTKFEASKDTRIVKIRGKKYKVWYKVSYKRGKRVIQILRVKPI